MSNVIGIDFGNWMAYVCFVQGMDTTTRLGGHIEDLIPPKYQAQGSAGLPNEFFWNSSSGELMGFRAAKEANRPAENHLRLLKKHLGESITLYGDAKKTQQRTFKYDDIIVKMFEYHAQLANETLRTNFGESATTNLFSITYPAKLRDPAALRYFIALAEKANSGANDTNGNPLKIKVVGAVCEPAAAGLDRLNEQRTQIKTDTVTYGIFDLGGGTFDLAIVSLFPNGRRYPNGDIYYYDLVCEGKGLNIAGSNFSDSLKKVMVANAEKELHKRVTSDHLRVIEGCVERCKLELTDENKTSFFLVDGFDDVEVVVTRQEFEKAIAPDVNKIMAFTRKFFDDHKDHKPDEIVMTGGSSYIPYIKESLEKTLPEYRGKIHLHRPSKAAAYGAARFYTMHNRIVRRTVEHDITTKVSGDSPLGIKMCTLIAKDTVLPCDSGIVNFHTHSRTDSTDYDIYVATKDNPNPLLPDTDYAKLLDATFFYSRVVPARTCTSCRLTIDSLGVAHLKAWMSDDTDVIKINETFEINNYTDDSTH